MNARLALPLLIAPLAWSSASGRFALDRLPATRAVGSPERFGQGLLGVNAGASTATFALAEASEIALVGVAPDGRVRPYYPLAPGESSRFAAGLHTVDIPEVRVRMAPVAVSETGVVTEQWRAYNACISLNRDQGRMPQEKGALSRDSLGRAVAPVPEPVDPTQAPCTPAPALGPSSAGQAGRWETENDVVILVVSDAPVTAEELRGRVAGVRGRSESDLLALPPRVAGDRLRPWAGYYTLRIPNPRSQESR